MQIGISVCQIGARSLIGFTFKSLKLRVMGTPSHFPWGLPRKPQIFSLRPFIFFQRRIHESPGSAVMGGYWSSHNWAVKGGQESQCSRHRLLLNSPGSGCFLLCTELCVPRFGTSLV